MPKLLRPRLRDVAAGGGALVGVAALILGASAFAGHSDSATGRPPIAVVTVTVTPAPSTSSSPRPSASPTPSREPDSGAPAQPPGVVVAADRRSAGDGARDSSGRGDPPSGGGGGAAPAPGPDDPPSDGEPPAETCPAGLVRAEVTLGARVCLAVGTR